MNDFRRFDAVIIGGGFYGARLALMLTELGRTVLLVEREPLLLGRASLRNQARVHNGYHYPRSTLTSLRSRLNYARFLSDYQECVEQSFHHYYAIARASKVTAAQFVEFCKRIGAPIQEPPAAVAKLFDSSRIESVFEVRECAFDAAKLRQRVTRELVDAGVRISIDTEAWKVAPTACGARVSLRRSRGTRDEWAVDAELVLNTTYSRINQILSLSGFRVIPTKHELTELAMVEPPPKLEGAAVTVMDGPFFSIMPYPSRGLFTLSHVRYTPHGSWTDDPDSPVLDREELLTDRPSRFLHMVRDAERYLPAIRGARYVDSLWEMKTLMPRSEQDDSRPILLRRSPECPALLSVLGAKIDSVYDVEDALRALLNDSSSDGPMSEALPLMTSGGGKYAR